MPTTNTDLESQEKTATERAREEAGRVSETAKQEAGQVVEEAKQQGRELLTDARDRMKEEAQNQTRRAAENLRSMSSEFRTMAESSQERGTAVSWVRMGADRMESLADRLDGGGLEGLMGDIGEFARRNPTTFLAVTFGAGLIAGRLVKNLDTDLLKEKGRESEQGWPTSPSQTMPGSVGSQVGTGAGTAQTGGRSQTGTGSLEAERRRSGTGASRSETGPTQGAES